MMMNSTTRNIEIYKATIENLSRTFTMEVEFSKVERKTLLTLENLHYSRLIEKYQHLKGVVMEDNDQKQELPIHVILGIGEYSKIKTKAIIKVGEQSEPVADKTHLDWTITFPGKDRDVTSMMLTRNSMCDHDQLCGLNVFGIEDCSTGDQMYVYQEFQDQLKRKADGSYETSLLWKPRLPPLRDNKNGRLSRLGNLIRKLRMQPKEFEQYVQIIKTQLSDRIIEKASKEVKGTKIYIPHKPVVTEEVESIKMRIVYNASAKSTLSSLSLNECLQTGPLHQNLLRNILIRNRFSPVTLCGDIKQTFLQVRINEEDRDAIRFH